ncbi:hypothetical protein MU852_09775 [Brevundimonas albigilva]|uniref:hypothetical protein n=1 Tax=Brevundimonas albigilva TaxID=1312364 RepID=UPI00201B8A19|nr:hypothetical protein [Brevundimonas albigilva]UQV19924.1 hypothetical protein MU852_09775 [Brevundimonas albigilva]
MTSTASPATPARPDVFLSVEDHQTLSRLVGDMPAEGVAGLLQQELDRAIVCEPGERPAGAAPLHRWLHYVDGRSPQTPASRSSCRTRRTSTRARYRSCPMWARA